MNHQQERNTAGGDLTPDQKVACAALATQYGSYGDEVRGRLTVKGARDRFGINGNRWKMVQPLLPAPDLLSQVADGALGLDEALNAVKDPNRLTALERHPFSAAYGDIQNADALEGMNASIDRDGLDHPHIRIHKGKVLDGWHRLQAAIAAGRKEDLQLRLFEGSDGEAWLYTIRENVHRRSVTTGTKAALAWQSTKAAAESQNLGIPPMTQEQAAKTFGVSAEYVRRFGELMQESPNAAEEVKSGKMTLNKAYEKVTASAAPQKASKKSKKSRGAGGGKSSNNSAAKANPNPQALKDAELRGRKQAEREAAQRADQAAQGHSAQVNAVNELLNDARDTIKVQDQENNRLRAENENLRNASNSEAGAKPETQADETPDGQGDGNSSRNEPNAEQPLETCKQKYKLIALRFEALLMRFKPDARREIEAIRKAVKEMPPDEVRRELDEVKRELEQAD